MQHRHHDEPRDNEARVAHARVDGEVLLKRFAENDKVEKARGYGRKKRVLPDLEKANRFLGKKRPKCNQGIRHVRLRRERVDWLR